MNTVTVLPWGRPLTAGDLELMPDDGHRYELLDGTLLVGPSSRLLMRWATKRSRWRHRSR